MTTMLLSRSCSGGGGSNRSSSIGVLCLQSEELMKYELYPKTWTACIRFYYSGGGKRTKKNKVYWGHSSLIGQRVSQLDRPLVGLGTVTLLHRLALALPLSTG